METLTQLYLCLLLLVLPLGLIKGKNVLEITDFKQDCENGLPNIAIDNSELETLENDDGNSILNGMFRFEDDYNDPIAFKAYSERLKHGSWTSGEISRDEPNICPLILNTEEPWYLVTGLMNQTTCPFKAGHSESFSNVVMGDLNMSIPDSFTGDWRINIEITVQRNGEKYTECVRMLFTIKEI
ncbi:uncharacterized protein LOC131430784 [Malaya genurostris]|uniref:uncharacterized protein LOC131430784 n=1 Tax=Malaya genurostris TaxID=325434 RepID=UPI0026F3F524|nr:uncharacterized protein LOC131430784 [Malaya genurostris]